MKDIKVKVKNAGEYIVKRGTSLFLLSKIVEKTGSYPGRLDIIGAKLNNEVRELSYLIDGDSTVEFIDLRDEDGKRMYRRSVHFVLIKAVMELFPEKQTYIRHSIGGGIYFELRGEKELTDVEVRMIRNRMKEIIRRKIPFVKTEYPIEYAKKVFLDTGREDKFQLIEHREKDYVSMYGLGETKDYFYGYMVPNTKYLKSFNVIKYKYGVIIIFPDRNDPEKLSDFRPQPKLYDIIREHEIDGRLLDCSSLGDLNRLAKAGRIDDLIEKSEYLHIVKIKDLATEICEKRHEVVFIAGPSSSGKTSAALRIADRLGEMSVRTITISMDDYFLDQEDTPEDMNGEKDFEDINAIDVELFRSNMIDLVSGREIRKPRFDFSKGKRSSRYQELVKGKGDVVLVEGIHGLNPLFHKDFSKKEPFRIYVSSLTSMNLDDHNRIPTTDTRLIRRLVRDNKYRSTSPENTFKRWGSVREGEERHVFPFQEYADAMFNTSLYYELSVLKPYADKIIDKVGRDVPEYSEARRLSVFLSYVFPAETNNIPEDSILREFVGGSILFK